LSEDIARLKHVLTYEFALWLNPLEEIVRSTELPSVENFRLAITQFENGRMAWYKARENFLAKGNFPVMPPDFAAFLNQQSNVTSGVFGIKGALYPVGKAVDVPSALKRLRDILESMQAEFYSHLATFSETWSPEAFKGDSPLAIYFHIKDIIASAKTRIHYFDRYMRDYIFWLYLRDLNRSLEIKLVTTQGKKNKAGIPEYGVLNLQPVAVLAKAEFPNFQLIEVDPKNMHDRMLRVDDQVFLIGSGITPGSSFPTHANSFAPADSSKAAHDELDTLIRDGSVAV
jgi:hypothetical protein